MTDDDAAYQHEVVLREQFEAEAKAHSEEVAKLIATCKAGQVEYFGHFTMPMRAADAWRKSIEAGDRLFALANGWLSQVARPGVTLDTLEDDWRQHGYRPTIRPDTAPFAAALADIYDFCMAERGLDVKAYRGS